MSHRPKPARSCHAPPVPYPSEPAHRNESMSTNGPSAVPIWWIEYENGDRSTDYASETEAWAVLVDPKSSDQRSPPAWLFSSDGQRFAIR